MAGEPPASNQRGYFGVAMCHPEFSANMGSVIRSTRCFGGVWVDVIGGEYISAPTAVGHDEHLVIYEYDSPGRWLDAVPAAATVVAVDYDADATTLPRFHHPERAVYVLGQEGPGFDRAPEILDAADRTVYIPTDYCLNVSHAATTVMYDRSVQFSDRNARM